MPSHKEKVPKHPFKALEMPLNPPSLRNKFEGSLEFFWKYKGLKEH
jgi:hypothetical protein